MRRIKLTGLDKKGEISLGDLLALVKQKPNMDKIGAIATFTGVVRGYTHEGEKVEKLELTAYDKVAESALKKISDDLTDREGVINVLIHHLIGSFAVGDDIVYVIVAGKSRREVFLTLIDAVERYKNDVPIWKKEYLTNGVSYWVSEK